MLSNPQTPEEIHQWLSLYDYAYSAEHYKIVSHEGSYIVHALADVDISHRGITQIPVKFGVIEGSFYANNNSLKSLENCPHTVKGNFHVNQNKLATLLGGPQKVSGNYFCFMNELTSLEGAPESVAQSFSAFDNQLNTLKGAPHAVGEFSIHNNRLTTLEFSPQNVGHFSCSQNRLISLQGAPQVVKGTFNCNSNFLQSLEGAPQTIEKDFVALHNQLSTLLWFPSRVGGEVFLKGNKALADFSQNNCFSFFYEEHLAQVVQNERQSLQQQIALEKDHIALSGHKTVKI